MYCIFIACASWGVYVLCLMKHTLYIYRPLFHIHTSLFHIYASYGTTNEQQIHSKCSTCTWCGLHLCTVYRQLQNSPTLSQKSPVAKQKSPITCMRGSKAVALTHTRPWSHVLHGSCKWVLHFHKKALYLRKRGIVAVALAHTWPWSKVHRYAPLVTTDRALHFHKRALYLHKRALYLRHRGGCTLYHCATSPLVKTERAEWRSGGLGSRPIFKKFYETYAPS